MHKNWINWKDKKFILITIPKITKVSTFLWLLSLRQSWEHEPNSMLPKCMTLDNERYPNLELHSLECGVNNVLKQSLHKPFLKG